MISISQYFDVIYGVNLELVHMKLDSDGINFVARTSENNGVIARVKALDGIEPNPANTISVAAGGSVMESFLQKEPYYSGRDLFYLKPKIQLSDKQLLYYCMCLKANKYKFNYGRQANRSLPELKIPSVDSIPPWVENFTFPDKPKKNSFTNQHHNLSEKEWAWFEYQKLFAIERGTGARKTDVVQNGKVPLITSIDSNNGIIGYVDKIPAHKGNSITVNRNGSVGQAFYQPTAFCSTEDVHVFVPKFNLNKFTALFIIPLIMKEKYRYSYGRKWGIERMKKTRIKLPVDINGVPDWQFMEKYIKSLPYSINL